MITWIQNLLQKHHKYVFSALLVVIIIAFVFTIGSNIPFFGDRNDVAEGNNQDFYGFNLRDASVRQKLEQGTYIEMLLNEQNPQSEQEYQNVYLTRALALSIAKQMNMPAVSQEELDAFIKSRPVFLNEEGVFSDENWNQFLTLTSKWDKASLDSVLADCALVEKVGNIIVGASFVQDAQIDMLYNQKNAKYTFSMATLDLSNFKPEIDMDNAKIEKFYEDNKIRYEVAREISLKLAFFPFADFANAEVVEGADRDAQIKRMAQQKAYDFSEAVYNAETTFASEKFNAILAESGAKLISAPSYSANAQASQYPKDFSPEIFAAGLNLDKGTWMHSDVIVSEAGAYVVFLDSVRDAYIPSLTDIRIEIERDYRAAETYALFSAKASALEKSLNEAEKTAKAFESVAMADGANVVNLDAMSLANPETLQIQALGDAIYVAMNNLAYMKENTVSKASLTREKAYIFFLSKKDIPAIDKDSEDYKTFASYVARITSMQSFAAFVEERIQAFAMSQNANK